MSDLIDHGVGIQGYSDLSRVGQVRGGARRNRICVLGEGEFEGDAYVLFGRGTNDDFAPHAGGTEPGRDRVTTGAHVAFHAPEPSASSAGRRGDRNGGADNGAPGVRPEYSGHYYAAFALDPDGNNVEAVFHEPVQAVEDRGRGA